MGKAFVNTSVKGINASSAEVAEYDRIHVYVHNVKIVKVVPSAFTSAFVPCAKNVEAVASASTNEFVGNVVIARI